MARNGLPPAAELGFADGSSYDRHRPSYPDEAVTKLLTRLGVVEADGASCTAKTKILDLGAGTGKFTELLAQRQQSLGLDLIAVEPHHRMREQLEAKTLRGVAVLEGSSTSLPLDDGLVDVVVAAQVCVCVYLCVQVWRHVDDGDAVAYSAFIGM